MKIRANVLVFPALVLGLGACGKKEETKAPAAPAVVEPAAPAEPATAPVPEVKAPAVTPEERAAKLGFVKHLPQDIEVVMAFHNGSKSAEKIQASKLWKLVQSQMGMGMGELDEPAGDDGEMEDEGFALPEEEQAEAGDPKDEAGAVAASPEEADVTEPFGPAALFGTEFTIALGKPVGEQTANLLTVNRRVGYFQMRALAKAFASAAKSGDFSTFEEAISDQYGPDLFKELLADPESGVGLFEKMGMPPLYLAFRVSEGQRDAAGQQLAALVENLGMFGEIVEPVEIEKAGKRFAGHKISGAKVAASMEENREEMESMMDGAAVDKLIAAVAKKDLVVLSGTIGDYALLFFGSSADDLNLASDTASSLVATESLAFCDSFLSKELAAVIYGQKAAIDRMIGASGGISDMAAGLRDGLSGAEGLGDTRDLEALLRMVGEREAALRKLAATDSVCTAVFFEDGLKIESAGGTDMGAVDWKAGNKLASLGGSEDVVMFANMTAEAAYDEKAREFLEALMETSYAVAMKVSEVPAEAGNMAAFKEMSKIFDGKFRSDAVAVWETLSGDFADGLGSESALVMDLNGSVPPLPGIPQQVVDQGKFPRISIIAPVADRAKLNASWEKINTSATGIMTKISEMAGQQIPMQKPISSEKDGFTTWFFAVPFFTDDFMPSVTVSDQWFAASTSKKQALDLLGKAAAGGGTSDGLVFSMNFKALEKFSREMLQVVEKNQEAILGENAMTPEQLKHAAQVIDVLEEVDSLTARCRRENGLLRTSIHLKTR